MGTRGRLRPALGLPGLVLIVVTVVLAVSEALQLLPLPMGAEAKP
jgi:hypothetical protein